MLIDSLLSVMLCAAGVFFAAHSPLSERKAAKDCSILVLIGCVAYNAAWFPPYPQILLGIPSTTYFCYISVIVACCCFEKSLGHWWGVPLFLLFIADICCHIARAFNEVAFYPYSVAVDTIGYLQFAIFVCIGGGGVRNRLFGFSNNVRNDINSHKAAQES